MGYVLPESMRRELKRPWGLLFGNTGALRAHMKSRKYAKIITVGDAVTACLYGNGLRPDVAIIDGYVGRKMVGVRAAPTMTAKNPAGGITDELFAAVKKAAESKDKEIILVYGEEDLATIPAVIHAPDGAAVLYGLPGRGAVLMEVDDGVRKKVVAVLERMDKV